MKKAALLVGVVCLLVSGDSAQSHEWYDSACCGGEDCHPVACDELIEMNDGGYKWSGFHFSREQIHPSKDSRCHVCVHDYRGAINGSPAGSVPFCVYILQGS